MPRRTRRTNGADAQPPRPPFTDNAATSARINTLYKKIMVALQDQRDLRCDLSSTRTRALLLDSEYVVLHAEYERSLAARDKLEALSRELARQNKTIDEESEARIMQEKKMREEIVNRFNADMMDVNKKLARQSTSREQRDIYVSNLQKKLVDLRERYDMREQHFEQQIHRKQLEKRLAEAKRLEVVSKHAKISHELESIRDDLRKAQAQYDELNNRLTHDQQIIKDSKAALEDTQQLFESQEAQIEGAQAEVKRLQTNNASARKQNSSTTVHLNAMDVECRRLEKVIAEHQELERKERAKVEALDKLCKQVTNERAELHDEIMFMQDTWTNLKQEMETLKDQDGDGNRLFQVLQNIMTRESLDLVVDSYLKDRKTIEEVVSKELKTLRVMAENILSARQRRREKGRLKTLVQQDDPE